MIHRTPEELSRRSFMSNTARTCLGVTVAPMLGTTLGSQAWAATPNAPTPRARNVIFLNMRGGMSHLDTFDTKPESTNVQGPVKSINTSADGIQISEYLPMVAKQMKHVAILPTMTSTQGAHAQAQYFLHASYVKRGTISHPCFGSWVSRLSGKVNSSLPANVVINGGSNVHGAGYMESAHAPLPIGNPDNGLSHSSLPDYVDKKHLDYRLKMAEKMNNRFKQTYNHKDVRAYTSMYDEAIKLMNSRDLASFDISQEPEYIRTAYGEDSFGKGCLLARRLVEANVRFIEVALNGWDTHNDNFERVEELCSTLDRGMGTLLEDLKMRGLLESTLVVLATEFGRTPDIVSGRVGRNHYPKAFTCLMAGAGIKGGMRHGQSDKEGREATDKPVRIVDLNATIATLMGIPLNQVITSPSKRPFTIADKGRPINDIIA